jgi:hypothetical protein
MKRILVLRCDNHVAGSKMQTALDQDLPPMGAGETVPPPMGAEETHFPPAFEAVYLPIRTPGQQVVP